MIGKKIKQKKRIAIISRESNEKSLDIIMIEEELRSRGYDVAVMCKLLAKDNPFNALGYVWQIMKQELAILKSDVVILDTYCIAASMLPHRRRTKIVQMWHALAAIKKFGWQTVGSHSGTSEKTARLMKMHRGYDHIICASDVTTKHFCEAFRAGEEKITKLGLPRIDYIKSVTQGNMQAETATRIYAHYPALSMGFDKVDKNHRLAQLAQDEKKTILYAPTFRKGQAVDIQSLIDAIDLDRYNLVIKLHPVYGERGDKILRLAPLAQDDKGKVIPSQDDSRCHSEEPRDEESFDAALAQKEGVVLCDEEFSSYDWLAVADIIISDYSSFVVEAALAEKPLYIYAYDMDEYERTTGLNMNFDEEAIAKYTFRNAEELTSALDEEYDFAALRSFRSKYIDVYTENCTEALADFIEAIVD